MNPIRPVLKSLYIALALFLTTIAAAETIQPKVMVIATYETGKDTGDIPGELQYWAEREHLTESIKVPGIDHPILTNGKGLYAMISGTTSRCAVQMMALAMDPRFDLRHTYFLLSGIGGSDPELMPIGGAVWVRQVIDGDPAFEIDSREIPAAWPYGTIALGATEPGKVPANVESAPAAGVSDDGSGGVGRIVYKLNLALTNWAYALTKDVTIPDTPRLEAHRRKFPEYPAAQKKPYVLEGEALGTDHFWHGEIMAKWGREWVRLYTRGTGQMTISDCEDQGIVLAMSELDRLGKVSFQRLMILRTGSNYVLPPKGMAPEKSLFENLADSPGYIPALDANYRVGSVVVAELLKGWGKFEGQIPQ